MLTRKEAGYFYDKLTHFYLEKESSSIARLSQICACFKEFYSVISSEHNRFFPNFYSRFEFVNRLLELDKELEARLRAVRGIEQSLNNPKLVNISHNTIVFALRTLLAVIEKASGVKAPPELSSINADIQGFSVFKEQPAGNDFNGLIVSTCAKDMLKAATVSGEEIHLQLAGNWVNAYRYLKEGETFNGFGLKKIGEDAYQANNASIIVLEPDYLLDVTDISECFTTSGPVPYIFFLRLFGKAQISPALVTGSIVNSIFDELIGDPDIDFDKAIDNAKRSRPLSLFALAEDREYLGGFNSLIRYYFDNIKMNLNEFKSNRSTVEPSFISSNYGIQGRLDLMLEQEGNRKDVVELKSGSPPSVTGHMKISGRDSIPTGLWNAHMAQANAYDILLNDAFDGRTGVSLIFYAKDEVTPLRNSASPRILKQMIADTRNTIVAIIKALAGRNYSIFDYLINKLNGNLPPFLTKEVGEFARHYNQLSNIEKAYFQEFSAFQMREILAEKIGTVKSENSFGFAGFWKIPKDLKEENFSIITGAELNLSLSDFKNLHLQFDVKGDSIIRTSIRKGDIVIIYPDEEPFISNPLKGMIFRGSLRSLDKTTATVSLRNKMLNADHIFKYQKWNIVSDSIDSNSRKIFSLLYEFISSPQAKRNLILGISEPEKIDKDFMPYSYLNDSHKKAFVKAIAAKDYFLLQGPPGTGKTSRFLKSMAEYFYHEEKKTILILAATNRAVAEIAESIKRIDRPTPYLRLGSKDGADSDENLIATLADTMELPSLRRLIQNSRIIISTVSSAINNPEIFIIKKFDIAIIDEASQIPEPQALGIALKVSKFIMIGDERQLPAVIRQSPEETATEIPELNEIGINDLSVSMFERLLRCAKKQNRDHVYSMLETQYRMSKQIQEFASTQFYLSKLLPGKESNSDTLSKLDLNGSLPLLQILAEKRLVFINTPPTREKKSNRNEARLTAALAVKIAELYGKNLSESGIGIIAPFRSQCAAIRAGLADEISGMIVCDTVERFQGSERDVIILSLSVNRSYELANIASRTIIDGQEIDRKLNVAMTRARDYLVITGASDILCFDPIFEKLIDFCKNSGGYMEYDEAIRGIEEE